MERTLLYGGRMQLMERATVAPGEDNEIYYKMLKWFHNNHPEKMDRYIYSRWTKYSILFPWFNICFSINIYTLILILIL